MTDNCTFTKPQWIHNHTFAGYMVRNVTVREGDDLLLDGEDDAAVKNVVINMDAETLQRLLRSHDLQIPGSRISEARLQDNLTDLRYVGY